MGYEVFGNNRSIVLPIPASTLTSAEYKQAYGIDLNSLELYNLVQVQDGKEVFPVLMIDKVNKILYTADRAFSYDGGFEEIADSLIAKVIEGGTIDNAKPIYIHPIILYKSGNLNLSIFIFDNSPEPYDTLAKVVNFARGVAESIGSNSNFPASGTYNYDGNYLISGHIFGTSGGQLYVSGMKTDGSQESYRLDNKTEITVLDGVNKIN